MKVTCKFLSHMRLDRTYSLLSARDVSVVLEFFKAMDVRGEMALDGISIIFTAATIVVTHSLLADIQFYAFMHHATDLSKDQIYRVFDMLDVDNSGLLDFDEFYLLVCILLAVRVCSWSCLIGTLPLSLSLSLLTHTHTHTHTH